MIIVAGGAKTLAFSPQRFWARIYPWADSTLDSFARMPPVSFSWAIPIARPTAP